MTQAVPRLSWGLSALSTKCSREVSSPLMKCCYIRDVVVVGPGFRGESKLGIPAGSQLCPRNIGKIMTQEGEMWMFRGRNSVGRNL